MTSTRLGALEIDKAVLQKLADKNARLAHMVELHYFGHRTCQQISETLKLSEATVDRDLRLAEAWILKQIRPRRTPWFS